MSQIIDLTTGRAVKALVEQPSEAMRAALHAVEHMDEASAQIYSHQVMMAVEAMRAAVCALQSAACHAPTPDLVNNALTQAIMLTGQAGQLVITTGGRA